MSLSNNHLVIMAGGIGSRFWPMSTPDFPKQFIDILGCGRTLLQMTVDRFDKICPHENIWIVTSAKYKETVKSQLPWMEENHILCEPCRRNTAPCIAYASWKIKKVNPEANIVVSPSDHIVLNTIEFQRVITGALDFTENSDAIVTLGMKPTRPETGYGYIEADLTYASPVNSEVYRVDSFKEKPDEATAQRYISKDNYFWNSGIFIWNVHTVVNAIRVYEPAIAKVFESLTPYYFTSEEQKKINEMFPMCENISIDYAVMEKADEIFVYPADFGWSDLGTWGSLHENTSRDAHNNTSIGPNIKLYETRNCVIHATEEKKVVVQGLEGYIIAEKNGELLICRLTEEQRIKDFSTE
ncbi:mannose-1-phosphate guanylyltransferase [Phocaeicola oris]|uniref:mannose-1-phosphate guanylyltransferase n=1 Tax=Phocaeicola oris TaxID=2896850 RepID=UPI00234E6E2F|nr:mannose-1-phosphate guanylyltransferase [Phocaeicola oris]MCE2616499.1 mannose-1-phosphate guanylyltransferase [Phocaeicola oris]